MLVVASYAYRLPALVTAGGTNSDAAVVGLQAMHLLRGEWSPFLLGSTYQTSVDSFVAAAFFVVLGPTPFALMLSSLTGHVALTLFAWATLARRLAPWTAALVTLPLVVSTSVVHGNALYPPRQAALTIAFAAFWALDGAVRAHGRARARAPGLTPRAEQVRFGVGGALASLACFADPYALLFAPLLGAHALLAAGRGAAGRRRVAAAIAGALVGAVPLVALLTSARSRHGETSMKLAALGHNFELLRRECLPWLLATTPYAPVHVMDWQPWHAPAAFAVVQLLGAAALVAGFGYAFVAGLVPGAARGVGWDARRLGLVGALVVPLALGGFLVSTMVMDAFSTRYLVAVLLLAPFALAPAAARLGARRFAVLLAPWLVSAGVCGWIGYRPFVDGVAVRTDAPGAAADDERLGARLRALGVEAGTADYWVAYRESFLFRETPPIAPTHASQDRYAPYRDALARASRWAYVVDRYRSEEAVEVVEPRVRAEAASSGAEVERVDEGSLVAFVVTKSLRLTR